MKIRPLFVYQNTKVNKEDFLLTPALFGVYSNEKPCFAIGIGIIWGWWSFGVCVASIPSKYKKRFIDLTNK